MFKSQDGLQQQLRCLVNEAHGAPTSLKSDKPPKVLNKDKTLDKVYPSLAEQWDYEKNRWGPEYYQYKSSCNVYWICKKSACGCHHRFEASIGNRSRNITGGCKFCAHKEFCCEKVSLKGQYPDIINSQWHPTKNIVDGVQLDPGKIWPSCKQEIWWLCKDNLSERNCKCPHEWALSTNARFKDNQYSGCPWCEGRFVCPHTSLAGKSIKCKLEWHPTKNGDLTPDQVAYKSNKVVWWKCEAKGHEWEAMILNRTQNKSNCPYCCNQKIGSDNNLLLDNPTLCEEWDFNKNNSGPETYAPNTNKKVWWICKRKGHSYCQSIGERNGRGGGCTVCPNKQFSKQSIDWLEHKQKSWPHKIMHANNDGEFSIPNTRYKADGYCKVTNTIFEYLGSFWHCDPSVYDLNTPFPVNPEKTRQQIYDTTLKKIQDLKDMGYNVIFIWEKQWLKEYKELKLAQANSGEHCLELLFYME